MGEDGRSPNRPSRAVSTASFVSSPLNPSPPVTNPFAAARMSRPGSQLEFAQAYHREPGVGQRGSMLLYRLASDDDMPLSTAGSASSRDSAQLLPPRSLANRDSRGSFESVSRRDSAFPSAPRGVLVAYEYDPAADEMEPADEEDLMHDPGAHGVRKSRFPWRGLLNVTVLVVLVLALLCLFVFYPVLTFYRNEARNSRIDGNIRINATGQAPVLFQMPDLIDIRTPDDAKQRTGFDGHQYDLVFSDEFEVEGRSFYPGDDPFWEAVDLWYGATGDIEWYDPQQVTTRNGSLVITLDSTDTLQSGLTPGSTAPFTSAQNHNLNYRSGMLQSWNKFCFSSGYIEVSVVLPGANSESKGYWPGAWTMGNLARPGYPATTDGMWPYTYNTCDVGTFPNQTLKDGSGPASALHSDASRSKYNHELSWLSGQRLSACSCPGSDHPGPSPSVGRGAPEIDIFEAEHAKDVPTGQVASMSAQFAPFTADYNYLNATADQWTVYTPDVTRPNTYKGSAVQQAVSGIVGLRDDMFQGSGRRFTTMGFEYWGNPKNPDEGFITWQVDGAASHRLGAAAVGPDQGPTGSGVGQRLIPVEPMSIVLNLGISPNWQAIDLSTLLFPAEMLVDYVRVYQRRGQTNVGCSPTEYPTEDYIRGHWDAYTSELCLVWIGADDDDDDAR
ncbi:hypothetical protein J132_01609 [Termitomyces sp. J132]|nr:hypothetical protein C0989_009319 [Termitomyces sp. Mn162]KNZ75764.1 hypothetical protein J132_01609 [Termitomyces sp. J132]